MDEFPAHAKFNKGGYLIFDEIFLILIKAGLLELNDLSQIFRLIVQIYENLIIEEHDMFKNHLDTFTQNLEIFAHRREILANILLHCILHLHDLKILKDHPQNIQNIDFFPSQQEVESDFKQYFNDILGLVIHLFESYICGKLQSPEFNQYLERNSKLSEICLHISYFLMAISDVVTV